ncbi:MAG: MlaD family protein [Afipia sp.]|uniref:Phospholipid/cholesterol/gamma-HCH transport system substrate-binding protein n=1 Tax=Afipia massiliensis TaxID=211460 RepID=A0A840N2F7_9BRAD|nr:MlaD family protein [Afipia massiliensis]MBB5054263.1 phospholipid/cholesterol/gamma-HCH transport system substrate-binding protein [Afipia massiliensis]MDZ4366584.1 MlaD family protein [Afipia sp.]
METKANFVLIGAFTLAVVAAAFGFVFWFQNLGAAAQRIPLRIVFEGAASGLRTGGNVNFNGIKIGEVTSIKLDDPKRVVVIANVDKSAPIRKDSLVGLEFAGLTGVSSVSLKGGSIEAGGVPVAEDGVPTLTADPNAIQDIGEAVRGVLQNVNKLVLDNQETLHNSMTNIEAFSKSLAANSARIDSIMAGVDGLMGEKGELHAAAKSFRELADNLDKRSAGLIIDGRRTLADISRAVNNFDRNPTRVLFGAGQKDAAPAPPPAPTPARNPADARARQR